MISHSCLLATSRKQLVGLLASSRFYGCAHHCQKKGRLMMLLNISSPLVLLPNSSRILYITHQRPIAHSSIFCLLQKQAVSAGLHSCFCTKCCVYDHCLLWMMELIHAVAYCILSKWKGSQSDLVRQCVYVVCIIFFVYRKHWMALGLTQPPLRTYQGWLWAMFMDEEDWCRCSLYLFNINCSGSRHWFRQWVVDCIT